MDIRARAKTSAERLRPLLRSCDGSSRSAARFRVPFISLSLSLSLSRFLWRTVGQQGNRSFFFEFDPEEGIGTGM